MTRPRPRDLSPELIASTPPEMAEMLLASIRRLLWTDMELALTLKDPSQARYRVVGAVQWSTLLAHRAREFYPHLKEGEDPPSAV